MQDEGKRIWSSERSLTLSRVCTITAMVGLAGTLVLAPGLVRWLMTLTPKAEVQYMSLFLATLYAGGSVAALLLVQLYILLHNIGRRQVFVRQNIRLLRCISWCCFAGALIAAASSLYYRPWVFIGLAAAFMGLIVRVVKNVFAEAILLKEENDYTI